MKVLPSLRIENQPFLLLFAVRGNSGDPVSQGPPWPGLHRVQKHPGEHIGVATDAGHQLLRQRARKFAIWF
jgi:hypothetical protein